PFKVSPKAEDLIKKLGDDCEQGVSLATPEAEFFKSRFNMINLEVALECLREVGHDFSMEDINTIVAPPGRFNIVRDKNQYFVIDFAHTPDALENICEELKNSFPEKALVCVFGCGG